MSSRKVYYIIVVVVVVVVVVVIIRSNPWLEKTKAISQEAPTGKLAQ